jgi:hypothetical protein
VAMASHNTLLVSAVREARRLQRQSSAIGLHDTLGENTRAAVEETRPSTVPSATATPSRRRRPPRPTSTGLWKTTGARSSGACSGRGRPSARPANDPAEALTYRHPHTAASPSGHPRMRPRRPDRSHEGAGDNRPCPRVSSATRWAAN